jgi:hypothetical protein
MREDCTPEEIAWAAGLFEGEGSMALGKTYAAQLVLCMTDEDAVARFADICGCGQIYPYPGRRAGKDKPQWRWVAGDKRSVEDVLGALMPWFCARRAARAVELLERLSTVQIRGKDRTHCTHGHEYTPENTYWWGPRMTYRLCRVCMADRAERRKRAKEEAVVAALDGRDQLSL